MPSAERRRSVGWRTVQIAIPLFDRVTALDAIGPYEVLSRLPGAEVLFVAAQPGPKRTDTGALALTAERGWLFFDQLRAFGGAEPTLERVVEQGKVVTAAGVSSGIDMALRLAQLIAGDDVAQAVQLSIEYDPQPPFDAGSPDKAPEPIVELVRQLGATTG
jgi:hypothetical protein